MRNVSDKVCTEIQITYFMSNFFFSKIVPFLRKSGKIIYSLIDRKWQYGACTLHAGYLRLQTHTHK